MWLRDWLGQPLPPEYLQVTINFESSGRALMNLVADLTGLVLEPYFEHYGLPMWRMLNRGDWERTRAPIADRCSLSIGLVTHDHRFESLGGKSGWLEAIKRGSMDPDRYAYFALRVDEHDDEGMPRETWADIAVHLPGDGRPGELRLICRNGPAVRSLSRLKGDLASSTRKAIIEGIGLVGAYVTLDRSEGGATAYENQVGIRGIDGPVVARDWVRGYQWQTTLSPAHLRRLGGEARLSNAAAFTDAEMVRHQMGSYAIVTIRSRIDEVTDEQLTHLKELLGPALAPTGNPAWTYYGPPLRFA